jgi:peptidoglycan/LPS O-acetylase OafA/YrhL
MTSRKYETLDGLRGVAALAVLVFHLPAGINSDAPSGYLAVDLFFLMSGFVIAAAYEKRLQAGWRVADFMLVRLRRLWPLYAVGLMLGVACFVAIRAWRPAIGFVFPHMPLALVILQSLAVLPQVVGYGGPSFPFNYVSWSLSVELIGNLAYAILVKALRMPMLIALTGAGFLGLAILAAKGATLDTGVNPETISGGYVRFLFSFPLGVMFYRLHAAGRLPVLSPPAWVPLLVAAALFVGVAPKSGLRDFLIVTVAFPLVLSMSLTNRVSPRVSAVFAWAGAMSYPLYILHMPLITAVEMLPGRAPDVFVSLATGAAAVALATLADRYFDRPLQRLMKHSTQIRPVLPA